MSEAPPHEELLAAARSFADDDPDPETRAELTALIAAHDTATLRERFARPLRFGTAGLRGPMGAGPACMNRATVARATAGICAELAASVTDARRRGFCVGFDGRHHSRQFAREASEVAAGAGFVVHAFEAPVPTPVLAFAVLDRAAAAGAMVTASHNPAADNGFKVYWEDGAQLSSPVDRAIAAAMAAVPSVRALPREASRFEPLGEAVETRYLQGVRELAGDPATTPLRIAYTALHGVGERFARAALGDAGFADVVSVPEQAAPDPDFPTVEFPNPEEPGAMDRVLALGQSAGAELVLANDPDADRLAVAARDSAANLRRLHGNEVGALLSDYLLGRPHGQVERAVVSSIVSTPMVASIAAAHGARWEPTLTGFKWICKRALELERSGIDVVFGFEEALGYGAGRPARDKDGISAAVLMAKLAAELKARGKTLVDRLDELAAAHGVWVSGQVALRLAPGSDAGTFMAAARALAPERVGRLRVEARIDVLSDQRWGTPRLPVRLPPADLVIWELEGGGRVMLRPSGTEPKVKIYIDLPEPVGPGGDVASARARATETVVAVEEELRRLLPG